MPVRLMRALLQVSSYYCAEGNHIPSDYIGK